MTDDVNQADDGLPPEIEASFREYYADHREELRRSIEISTGFYDKLAALNAGSIAILVSVGFSILAKLELHGLSHGILTVILCFWVSLLTSISHNYLLLWSAKLDAAYSRDEFIRNMLKTMLRHPWPIPGLDSKQMKQVEDLTQEEPIKNQGKTVAWKRRCESTATVVGIIAVVSFFVGYTLVVAGALKLWL